MTSPHCCFCNSIVAIADTACAAPFLAPFCGEAKVDKVRFLIIPLVSCGNFSHRSLYAGSYNVKVTSCTLERMVFLKIIDPKCLACSGLDSSANSRLKKQTN